MINNLYLNVNKNDMETHSLYFYEKTIVRSDFVKLPN